MKMQTVLRYVILDW